MQINPAAVTRRTIARELQLQALAGAIHDGADFRDALGADSLDMIAIAASLEDDFDIVIDDGELSSSVTVADLIALVERKVGTRG